MPVTQSEYASFLRPGDLVNVGIDLPDRTFAEDLALVIADETGEIMLQLCGSGFPAHLPVIAGSKVIITRGEGKTTFHGTARLREPMKNGALRIEFPQQITLGERREYMRVDVMLPVNYSLPATQSMEGVITEWERLRDGSGDRAVAAGPPAAAVVSRVNLSGSGLRFKIRDCLSYGTLLHLHICLPGDDPEPIHAVGAIIRTKELVPQMVHCEYYSTSMAFRMIESGDRLRIMKYILDAQRRNHTAPPRGYL